MQTIRPAAVAGQFYPGNADILRHDVLALLAGAHPPVLSPKVLIAPHAGYIYSGPVAASAYAALKSVAAHIRRVVLLGPTHRVAVRGLALPEATAFATPLGEVPVDAEAERLIADLPQVVVSAAAHAQEHSLEVHLPFLQTVLGDFKLLPLAVGAASAEEVAEVLERVWGGDETLIVVSSDLSHYLPYETAKRVDGISAQDILQLSHDLSHEQACGATPINGLLRVARRRHLAPHLLDLRNSGDTAGPHDGVVGYAAFAFTRAAPDAADPHTDHHEATDGRVLLQLARSAIAETFGAPPAAVPDAEWLREPGATFVTLTQRSCLRGCIGSLEAHRPLREDVHRNAVAAAFRDPRFAPLSADELGDVRMEVSLLSEPQPLVFRDEADALAQLRPHLDGVIFQYGPHHSTFLPQVWEQLSDPHQFMAHLKQKAGLPADFWSSEVRLARYTVAKWQET